MSSPIIGHRFALKPIQLFFTKIKLEKIELVARPDNGSKASVGPLAMALAGGWGWFGPTDRILKILLMVIFIRPFLNMNPFETNSKSRRKPSWRRNSTALSLQATS